MQESLEFFKIGKIVSTRGLKGEIKIYSHTDEVERFLELEYIYIGKDREKKYEVEKSSISKNNTAILKLSGYDTIESVQGLMQKFIYVDRENAYELDEDEYFIADMIGISVETVDGRPIGNLVEVLQYTANDVYVVKNSDGKEYLIPATYEVVPEIDMDEKVMKINPIAGLLDD